MAKGDSTEVISVVGGEVVRTTITASKAGRRVQTTRGTKWLAIEVVTRNGKPVGDKATIRTDAVVAIRERQRDA